MIKQHCIPARFRPSRSGSRTGFGLVELTVTVTLVALLAGGALMYYQGVRHDSNLSTARVELTRIRDELHRWLLLPGRKPPQTLADLKRLDGSDDPWGRPYVLQLARRRVVSSGPNRELETDETMLILGGDDLGCDVVMPGDRALASVAAPPPALQVSFEAPNELLPGQPVQLDLSALGPAPVARLWLEQVAGPELDDQLLDVSGRSARFVACETGTYVLRARAEDTAGAAAQHDVSIVVDCRGNPGLGVVLEAEAIVDTGTVREVRPLEPLGLTLNASSTCTWLREVEIEGAPQRLVFPASGTNVKRDVTVVFPRSPGPPVPRAVALRAVVRDGCGKTAEDILNVLVVPEQPVR